MAAEPNLRIPILTDALGRDDHGGDTRPVMDAGAPARALEPDREALIAELQTQIAAHAFALTDDILRQAFAEMEASIFEQITGRLRRELPEMIDRLLRERLGDDRDV